MKKSLTVFLKTPIILIGIGVLAALIRFPQTEGRAANLTLIEIYSDPLIIYMYIAFITFFVGLFQAFKLVEYMDTNNLGSDAAIRAFNTIKYCAIIFASLIAAASGFLFVFYRGTEDGAGAAMMAFILIIISLFVATLANVFRNKFMTKEIA